MRRGRLTASALLLLAILLPAGCASTRPAAGNAAGTPEILYIEADTTWSGDVRVAGVVHVRKSATLTILPGTRVLFAKRTFPQAADSHEGFVAPGIRVDGRIVAVGTEESPVLFTSEGTPAHGSWDKILFTFSEGNRFERCVFEGARYAFHSHFSGIEVRDCVFRDNEEGVRLGTSRVRIEGSVFTRNLVRGINFRECRNEIRRNLVYGNGDGIFLHSKTEGSVVRENAIYGNRHFNLRLGDLHTGDIDVSGNWWGTGDEDAVRRTIHDGAATPGVGAARVAPVLSAPPVTGAEVRGVFAAGMLPVAGGHVRAYVSIAGGFWSDDPVAAARTDESGLYRLPVPPGRYFVVGKAEIPAGSLFAFPGKNPVSVEYGETADVGLPAVAVPSAPSLRLSAASRPSIAIRATLDGEPVAGATVQASRPDRPDFRGPGEASAVTGESGSATLYLPPGKYLLSAKKRTTGAPLGMVEEGGLFGVYPFSPVDLPAGTSVAVEIPMFEKRGLLGGGVDGERGESTDSGRDVSRAVPEGATRARWPATGFPEGTIGGVVSGRMNLSGRVRVTADLLVLPGATLELAPGSELVFDKGESSKVDPEFFFGGTELVVRGALRADGAKLLFADRTGGVVVDGGSASLKDTAISGAEAGLTLVHGGKTVVEGNVTVRDCRTGVALFPGARNAWTGGGTLTARGNAVGAVRFPGAPGLPPGFRAEASEEADTIDWDALAGSTAPVPPDPPLPGAGARRIGDTFLESDRTLEGDVIVEGILRVAPGVTLTILPGSRLFFTFRDTDGDGIGENGIFLQGNLRAKGTADRPIGFHAAEGNGPGRWDSINFMASERGENVLEHVEISGAYRGLHGH
ncbi:MAG: NosD domain-containing protein, partial [bacterium]|nr:NosD domain-containing protein [bacterium]